MKFLFKLFLTLSSTGWLYVIYFIKENVTLFKIPIILFDFIIMLVPVILSVVSILFLKCKSFSYEQIKECNEFSLADNQFLPVYLGYFFVALSIPNFKTLIFIYIIIFAFVWLSEVQYFNPSYLLFGYHFYLVVTKKGTNILIISRGEVKRNLSELHFDNLKRINNTTFIEVKRGNK